jgi:hypothetical protein
MKIANRSFENVSHFKYLWTTVTNYNFIYGEIKRKLNSGNACYHSVQNRLLSKNEHIQDCNFASGAIWLWRLVSDIRDEGVWEWGAQMDIWTEEGWSDRKVEKTAYWGALWFVLCVKYNEKDQVKEDEMDRTCSMNGGKRNACRLLLGKPEWKSH